MSIQKRTKSDSFAAHFEKQFQSTMSRIDLLKYMTFQVVKQLNLIGAMKTVTKPNCNQFIEERLTIHKNICEKCVTIMNNNSEVYGAFRQTTTVYQLFLSTDDPMFVFNGSKS